MDNTIRAYRRSNGELLWHPSRPVPADHGSCCDRVTVIVSGSAPELRAFESATGKSVGQITLEEPLAMPPAFGRSGSAVVMAAFTGSLTASGSSC